MQNVDDTKTDEKTLGETKVYKNLEYWMSDLPPQLKTLPINHLAIPGRFGFFIIFCYVPLSLHHNLNHQF